MKQCIAVMALLLLFSACGKADGASSRQTDAVLAQISPPELETAAWQTLSTDAAAFGLTGGFDNPNFTYVFNHTDTVPLDQLAAFLLAADSAAEGAQDELRSRFLEAPNTVLTYLMLLEDQVTELPGWDPAPIAELLCGLIASADAAWHNGSEEFTSTVEECRQNYPEGRVAALLDILEEKHTAYMEQTRPNA